MSGLSRPFAEARYQAASALRDLGPRAAPAVAALILACGDTNDLVQVASIKALGSIGLGASNALPALRNLADSQNSFSASAAGDAISRVEAVR
jgi:hypothetical protein